MNTSEKFLYLIAGTGIGATLGILFAPKSGQELRETLSSKKVAAGGTVRSMVDRGKQALNESVENVKTRFNESVETGKAEYRSQRAQNIERDAY